MLAGFLAVLLQATPQPSPLPAVTASPSPAIAATPLAVAPWLLGLHPGQSAALTVSGGVPPYVLTLSAPLATAVASGHAGFAVIAGAQPGEAVMTVTDAAGAAVPVPLRIALDAAAVPPAVQLAVTGDPVDPAWLDGVAQRAVRGATAFAPGVAPSALQLALPPLPASALSPGGLAAVPASVTVPGDAAHFAVTRAIDLDVQNVAVSPFSPAYLLYDDDPEKVDGFGLLYARTIAPQTPVRLYYYHQDVAAPRNLYVVLRAVTPGDPAEVQAIDASAGPNIDVMSVGHAVTRDFLEEKPANEGLVVTAGAAPAVLNAFTPMAPIDGAAGSIGLRVLSGGSVEVAVVAVPPDVTSPAAIAGYLAGPALPGDGHHRTGVFVEPDAYAARTVAYTVGGPDATTIYGATMPPSADPSKDWHDYGDYGVLRTLTFDLANPTASRATLYLFEQPMGGVVRSSFLIDGVQPPVQVGCVRVSVPYQVGAPIELAPGASRQLVVQTMTDGGSNYPLEVGVTATPPQPAAPPISAPDGCFPKRAASPVPGSTPLPAPEPTG